MSSAPSSRPWAVLVLAAALLIYVGCDRFGARPEPSSRPADASGRSVDGAPSSDKLLADWPTVRGALVITGDQEGYQEPCGCTDGQLGGLRRRYDLVERLRAQKLPLGLVDLGNLLKDPVAARGGLEQSKIKFTTSLKALALLKYDVLAPGPEDLKVGVDEALAQYLNLGERPKVVAANVAGKQGFETLLQPSARIQVGPYKIGVTAVVDPATLKAVADPALDALLSIRTPEEALPSVLADLEKDTDRQVLLVQGPPELAKTLAEKFPGFEVVVGASEFDEPSDEAETASGGKTIIVRPGKRGKYVAVVGLFDDPKRPARYQRVQLGKRLDGPAEPMRALLDDEYQGMLKAARIVEDFPRRGVVNSAPGATFVGAETCKSCHPKSYEKWEESKHAQAFEPLIANPKRDMQFDAECVSCHTTGFEYKTGWVSAEKTPLLEGNQCENCHGPASRHIAAPDDKAFRQALALKVESAEKDGLCQKCHDGDNSPHFDFKSYWHKIEHSKLDTYTDPKVHQAIGTKAAATSR